MFGRAYRKCPFPQTPREKIIAANLQVKGMILADFDILRVNKTSGVAFLEVASRAWIEKKTLLIADTEPLGASSKASARVESGGGWWRGDFNEDASENIAQISVTSGTTGMPKLVAISRRAISDTVGRLQHHMEMDASIREYVAVPVTFSFGLARARAVAASGGQVYLPSNGFRPDEIAKMLERNEINALSAVPTMLRSVLANPQLIGRAGRKLRWLEIGSQYLAASEKRKIRELFPEAVIMQHYGLTEASRSTFLRIDLANDDELETVGRPVDDGGVRIAPGGEIEVRGPHLASGLIENGVIRPFADPCGWLRTNDLGQLHGDWLEYKGRVDDVANVGGVKVSAEVVEKSIRERVPADVEFAVCVIPDKLRGEKLAIAFAGPGRGAFPSAIREVARANGLKQVDIVEHDVDALPRTDTGKVIRSRLADIIVGRQIGQAADPAFVTFDRMSAREAEIATIWAEALGIEAVGRHDSFYDLGGDSLSAIGVIIKAEQLGLPPYAIQGMFSGETIAEIAAAIDQEEPPATARDLRSIRADALNALRGVFALLIILSHWGPFFVERAGTAGALAWSYLSPALRIGTPGFAMIYGMGLGLFFMAQLGQNDAQVRRRMWGNTQILLAGVAMIGAAQAWRLHITGEGFGPVWPEQLFYQVLLFYLIMVPTSLFWLRRIVMANDPLFASLVLAIGSYATYLLCSAVLPENSYTGWSSLGWHMLVAPYAYPRLLGATALGLAAAIWLQRDTQAQSMISRAAKAGSILVGLGWVMVSSTDGGWLDNAGELVAIPAFAGATLLLYAGALRISALGRQALAMQVAVVCGMLAFPLFIGHGLVAPIKDSLKASGLPTVVAMALPITVFLAVVLWFGLKLYRAMFSAKHPI
ncbi:AMP-binding protein [Sphingopyxis sp. H050]|uniref:AMP-binding protein n=1 Tax=Sphingopyxis sp. H050 TaxID=1759072 RepID=UPI000A9E7026|nr:AMP-binding protein [Sphingopyxis sp. H050]